MPNERFGNKGELEFDVANLVGAIDWCLDFNPFFHGKPRDHVESQLWKSIERTIGGFTIEALDKAIKFDLEEACGLFYKVDKIIDYYAELRPDRRSPYKINFFIRPGRTLVTELLKQNSLDQGE